MSDAILGPGRIVTVYPPFWTFFKCDYCATTYSHTGDNPIGKCHNCGAQKINKVDKPKDKSTAADYDWLMLQHQIMIDRSAEFVRDAEQMREFHRIVVFVIRLALTITAVVVFVVTLINNWR